MNSEAQEDGGPSDFLAFGSSGNDDNRGYRNNFQYRPYNRNRNQRNQNFRRNQPFGGQDEGNPHFTPANFNGPGGYNKRFNDGFRGRPNHTNNFQNRRNFTPYNKFGGNAHQNTEISIQDYVHKSMVEDPWADCHKYRNGGKAPDLEENESNTDEATLET